MSEYIEGIGRRKEASARVRIYFRGAEQTEEPSFIVNDKPVQEFFPRYGDYQTLIGPLEDSGLMGKVDVTVLVQGGGITGQSGAVSMGIARAISHRDEDVPQAEQRLRPLMRRGGFLTRDPREKERKKPGLKRARKAPQYTKR